MSNKVLSNRIKKNNIEVAHMKLNIFERFKKYHKTIKSLHKLHRKEKLQVYKLKQKLDL